MDRSSIAICFACVTLLGCEGGFEKLPKPPPHATDACVTASDASKHTVWCGLWWGDWDGGVTARVDVRRTDHNGNISLIYSYSSHPSGRFDAASHRYRATAQNSTILIYGTGENGLPLNSTLAFRLMDRGTIEAEFRSDTGVFRTIFENLDPV